MDIGAHAVHCIGVSDVQRIESLEQMVRALHPEVQDLRAEVERLRAEIHGAAGAARPGPEAEPEPRAPRGAAAMGSARDVPGDRPGATVGSLATAGSRTEAAEASAPTVERSRGDGPRPAPAAAGRPMGYTHATAGATRPDFGDFDLEALIGRYGTLALATLTILLGVGAFISWAIAHHLLGPTVRVVIGAILAVALAVTGWRIRRTGAISFSNALLGIALAVVHVDAWGAGPYLHLISSSQALTVAALASVALSAFARVQQDELLFSLGVGGALLAPFVTSDGTAHVIPLLLFGFIVLELALTALRDAEWAAAVYVVTAGCALYTGAGIAASHPGDPAALALAPAVFALGLAIAALVVPPRRHRTLLAQSALVQLAIALLPRMALPDVPMIVALAALGTVVAYATLWLFPPSVDIADVAGVGLLPLGLMAAAMSATRDHDLAALVATGWAVAAATVSALDRPERRGAHLTVVGLASSAAIIVPLVDPHPLVCVAALSAHAALVTLLMHRRREPLLALPVVIDLSLATVLAFVALYARPDYYYVPFATRESAAALALCAAWLLFSWHASRLAPGEPKPLVRVAGLTVTFFWWRTELAGAESAQAATFLLIAYYATVGVGAVFLGRARAIPLLRHGGLALAMYAAIKAVIEAADLGIGLRISSYFLAGLFMLAVAYWYRAADVTRA